MSPTAAKAAEVIDKLTAGWEIRQIQEVADVNPRIDKKAIPDDIEVSFVPMPAVEAESGEIDVSQTKLAQEVKKGFTAFLQGDVLFAKITPCMENGKMAIAPALVNNYGFGSTEFHVLRPRESIDAKYLYYYVSSKSFRGKAERFMTGAVGQKRVSTNYIKEATIPVAPIEDQHCIVAEIEKQFSRLDEVVARLKRVEANLKRYKPAVLKAAVEGKLTEEWRKQNPDVEPASKLLERILAERRTKWEAAELAKMKAKGKEPKNNKWKQKYKEAVTPLFKEQVELPDSWVWATWEQLLSFDDGAFRRGPFGGALKKSIFVDEGYKVYEQYCPINDDPYFGRYFITEEKYRDMENFWVKERDFLISCSGTIGRITQIPLDHDDGVINQALLRVRVNDEILAHEYFLMLFRSPYFQRKILDSSQGAAMQNVKGVKELRAIAIPLPPKKEQEEIRRQVETRLSVYETLEAELNASIRRLSRLRQSVLADSFSGGVVAPLG